MVGQNIALHTGPADRASTYLGFVCICVCVCALTYLGFCIHVCVCVLFYRPRFCVRVCVCVPRVCLFLWKTSCAVLFVSAVNFICDNPAIRAISFVGSDQAVSAKHLPFSVCFVSQLLMV